MVDDWKSHSLARPQVLNVTSLGGGPSVHESYTIAYYHHMHCIVSRLAPHPGRTP